MTDKPAPKPVFISYARRSKAAEAQALAKALGNEAFLDTDEIELGETFPETLTEALLGAKVVVVFADEAYFQRWYCGKEWGLATAAFDARVRRGDKNAGDELDALVIAFPEGALSARDQARLPPRLQRTNCPTSGDTSRLAAHVLSGLNQIGLRTVRERLEDLGALDLAREAFGSENAMPEALVHEQALYAPGLPESLKQGFVGRSNALWSLHGLLLPPGRDPRFAGLTGALAGGGGFGKTCMAREYFHRYGPRLYAGGCFWIDGTTRDEDIQRELHGVMRALDYDLPSFEDMSVDDRHGLRHEVATALRSIPADRRVLWVVDNLPEPGEDEDGLPTVDSWCPEPSRVTLLTTSRTRTLQGVDCVIDVDILDPDAACAVLERGLKPPLLREHALAIATWLGHLPLALDLANKALEHDAVRAEQLVEASRGGASVTRVTDAALEALRPVLPTGALRGIGELFTASYENLSEEAREVARLLAWTSPEPVSDAVLEALITTRGGTATRVALKACSFIRDVREDGIKHWIMHRVLADFLRSLSGGNDDGRHGPRPDGGKPRVPGGPPPALDGDESAVAPATTPPDVERLLDAISELLTSDTCHDPRQRSDSLAAERLLASIVPRIQTASRRAADRLHAIGTALDSLGNSAGLSGPTRTAIAAYQAALTGLSRERDARAWASTQNNLGNVLRALGERQGNTAKLEQAVAAYQNALDEYTRLGAPFEWATAQNNLGFVLRALGQQQGDIAQLNQAVVAYRNALLEYTREHTPLEWAGTQNNLGIVLKILGERQGNTAQLEQAVAAYENALLECTRERAPGDWAMIQNNLGNVLRTLGQQQDDTTQLEQAVTAYRKALLEYTRERAPLDWATAQNNLGNVLGVLGQQQGDTAQLEQAVVAYRNALLECARERAPLEWAGTQSNLGIVLGFLGQQQGDSTHLEQALRASRLALEVFEEAGATAYADQARQNLAAAERALRDASDPPPPT